MLFRVLCVCGPYGGLCLLGMGCVCRLSFCCIMASVFLSISCCVLCVLGGSRNIVLLASSGFEALFMFSCRSMLYAVSPLVK